MPFPLTHQVQKIRRACERTGKQNKAAKVPMTKSLQPAQVRSSLRSSQVHIWSRTFLLPCEIQFPSVMLIQFIFSDVTHFFSRSDFRWRLQRGLPLLVSASRWNEMSDGAAVRFKGAQQYLRQKFGQRAKSKRGTRRRAERFNINKSGGWTTSAISAGRCHRIGFYGKSCCAASGRAACYSSWNQSRKEIITSNVSSSTKPRPGVERAPSLCRRSEANLIKNCLSFRNVQSAARLKP